MYRLRGSSLLRLDRHKDAIAMFDGYFEHRGPRDADVYRDRARAYVQTGDHSAAIGDYNEALKLTPADGSFYVARGEAYLIGRDYPRAWHDFDKAIELGIATADVFHGRGYADVKRERTEDGVKDAEEAVRRAKDKPNALRLAARIYAQAFGNMDRIRGEGRARAAEAGGQYRERAVGLLRTALRLLRDDAERRAFWQRVTVDDAFDPLRNSMDFLELDKPYSRRGTGRPGK